ncbi:hypothetical protein DVH05_021501 [Phytophthora capsici]|nr:hypothetical protein DVH05_021501 [Phytophthora capsici]
MATDPTLSDTSDRPVRQNPSQQPVGPSSGTDGMTVELRRKSKAAAKTPAKSTATTSKKALSESATSSQRANPIRPEKTVSGHGGKPRDNRALGSTKAAFKLFQQAREFGRYQALMEDSDSESEESDTAKMDTTVLENEDNHADDADYAFPEPEEAAGSELDTHMEDNDIINSGTEPSLHLPDVTQAEHHRQAVRVMRQREDEDDTRIYDVQTTSSLLPKPEEETSLSSYVGSSAPTHTPSPAATPGSEFPFSIASTGDSPSNKLAQRYPPDLSISQASSSSSPIYAGQGAPPQNPVQAMNWLSWFQGQLVRVSGQGQCAILSWYASVSNHPNALLTLSAEDLADANFHKRAIYALVVENLHADCLLGLVNPIDEVAKLYPGCDPPTTPAAALAVLCTDLLLERERPVDARVPLSHWVGPQILRAYAQYLRYPISVLDMNEHGDAHLQIYSYRDYDLPHTGGGVADTHESGQYTAFE